MVNPQLRERTAGARYIELDALRGLAAFTVLWHHYWLMFSLQPRWFFLPLICGPQAVVLFFLLSGFVLSLPFWNHGTSGPYLQYITRRFFRVYLPFAAAVGVAAVGAYTFRNLHLALGQWYESTWHVKLTSRLIIHQLLMAATPKLNTAFWSLRYEVQMSILFPLILYLIHLLRPRQAWMMAVILYICALMLDAAHWPDPFLGIQTIRYGSIFIFGALLAKVRAQLHSSWSRTRLVVRSLFVVCSLLLYLAPRAMTLQYKEVLTVMGATGLMLASMYSPLARNLLHLRIPQYLGRISYSLYLIHGTVLFASVDLLYGRVALPFIAVIYLIAAILLAHVFCVWIEEPSLRAGKRIIFRVRL